MVPDGIVTFVSHNRFLLPLKCTYQFLKTYCKTSTISRTLVGNKIVDNSDVVGTSPVSAAPTTFSFST